MITSNIPSISLGSFNSEAYYSILANEEETVMRVKLGYNNESNLGGIGLAMALAGVAGTNTSPLTAFPNLSACNTIADIAKNDSAIKEAANNPTLFKMLCLHEFPRTAFGLAYNSQQTKVDSSYNENTDKQTNLDISTTTDFPLCYFYGYVGISGSSRSGATAYCNIMNTDATKSTRLLYAYKQTSSSSGTLVMDDTTLVFNPVTDYGVNRDFRIQFVQNNQNHNYGTTTINYEYYTLKKSS